MFPYEWLDNYDRLTYVGPVAYSESYSRLKGSSTITREEYDKFVQEFSNRGCVTMMDWLKVYNEANVIPFTKALDKTRRHYPDKIGMLKDAVSIPGISMTYVLNRSLIMKKRDRDTECSTCPRPTLHS